MASAFDLLTAKQKKVYSAIENYIKTKGIPPTVREIGELIGEKTPGAVQGILNRLQQKGVIKREEGMARSIQLVMENSIYLDHVYIPEVKKVTARNADDILNVYNIKQYHPLSNALVKNPANCFILSCPQSVDPGIGVSVDDLLVISTSDELSKDDLVVILSNMGLQVVKYSGKAADGALLTESPEGSVQLYPENTTKLIGIITGRYSKMNRPGM